MLMKLCWMDWNRKIRCTWDSFYTYACMFLRGRGRQPSCPPPPPIWLGVFIEQSAACAWITTSCNYIMNIIFLFCKDHMLNKLYCTCTYKSFANLYSTNKMKISYKEVYIPLRKCNHILEQGSGFCGFIWIIVLVETQYLCVPLWAKLIYPVCRAPGTTTSWECATILTWGAFHFSVFFK
jgi:hypothetical protein